MLAKDITLSKGLEKEGLSGGAISKAIIALFAAVLGIGLSAESLQQSLNPSMRGPSSAGSVQKSLQTTSQWRDSSASAKIMDSTADGGGLLTLPPEAMLDLGDAHFNASAIAATIAEPSEVTATFEAPKAYVMSDTVKEYKAGDSMPEDSSAGGGSGDDYTFVAVSDNKGGG